MGNNNIPTTQLRAVGIFLYCGFEAKLARRLTTIEPDEDEA